MRDDEGAELANEQAARARAVKEARALAAETVARGTDEHQPVIGTVRFGEAVDIRP